MSNAQISGICLSVQSGGKTFPDPMQKRVEAVSGPQLFRRAVGFFLAMVRRRSAVLWGVASPVPSSVRLLG